MSPLMIAGDIWSDNDFLHRKAFAMRAHSMSSPKNGLLTTMLTGDWTWHVADRTAAHLEQLGATRHKAAEGQQQQHHHHHQQQQQCSGNMARTVRVKTQVY